VFVKPKICRTCVTTDANPDEVIVGAANVVAEDESVTPAWTAMIVVSVDTVVPAVALDDHTACGITEKIDAVAGKSANALVRSSKYLTPAPPFTRSTTTPP
jgi:hypothetical protein